MHPHDIRASLADCIPALSVRKPTEIVCDVQLLIASYVSLKKFRVPRSVAVLLPVPTDLQSLVKCHYTLLRPSAQGGVVTRQGVVLTYLLSFVIDSQ